MVINFSIPDGSHCLLKEGQRIDFDTPFIEKKTEAKISIPVSKKLDINPSKIFRYLIKLVGEKIKKGETIAVKKGLFKSEKIISEYEGLIQEIDHLNGIVIITTSTSEKKIKPCFFKGKIKEIKKEMIKIEVEKGEEFSLKTASSYFGGETFYLDKKSSFSSNLIAAKIVVSDSISPFIQTKIEALGAQGFVTLIKLPENTDLFQAQIKNIDDMKKIKKLALSYCLIDKKSSKIVFYQ